MSDPFASTRQQFPESVAGGAARGNADAIVELRRESERRDAVMRTVREEVLAGPVSLLRANILSDIRECENGHLIANGGETLQRLDAIVESVVWLDARVRDAFTAREGVVQGQMMGALAGAGFGALSQRRRES